MVSNKHSWLTMACRTFHA